MLLHLHTHSGEHSAGFHFWPVLLHSLLDSAKMLPFLLAAYLLIEYIEQRKGGAIERVLARGGRWGFVPGALLGLVPQCGFSAMAANFYGSRVITLGTLLAVFIATSDEAIPVMLAQPGSYGMLLALVLAKLAWALAVGLLLDVVLRRAIPQSLRGGYGGSADEVCCHRHSQAGHSHSGSTAPAAGGHDAHSHAGDADSCKKDGIFLAALKHTLNIFLVVLAFTLAFGLLVEWLGEDAISAFLSGLGIFQPAAAALFGLVPNCASSVLLTQLYTSHAISFGAVFAGLSANAGIGLTVLFRANKSLRQNLFILALLFMLGVLPGTLLHLAGL